MFRRKLEFDKEGSADRHDERTVEKDVSIGVFTVKAEVARGDEVFWGISDVAAPTVSGQRVGKEGELCEANVGRELGRDKRTVISQVKQERRNISVGR